MRLSLVFCFAFVCVVGSSLAPSHAGVVPGSTYTVSGKYLNIAYAAAPLTFDGSDKSIFGGLLLVHETTHDEDSHHQWVEFSIRTADGNPFPFPPGNGAPLSAMFSDIQFDRPALAEFAQLGADPSMSTNYDFVSANGSPQAVVSNFGLPFFAVGPHPFVANHPAVMHASFDPLVPYSAIPNKLQAMSTAIDAASVLVFGGNPSSTDEIDFGLRFSTIPEPSTFLLFAAGLAVLASRRRWRSTSRPATASD